MIRTPEAEMTFTEALDLAINEQWAERVRMFGTSEFSKSRAVIAISSENFRIPVEVMSMEGVPEGTTFGTFNNCREYGVTFKRNGWTFALYEHRNSDDILLQGCPDAEVQPYGPYGVDSDDKWDCLATFKWREYWAAAEALNYALKLAEEGVPTRKGMKERLARQGF